MTDIKPVAVVTVGQHDHGPFVFRETAYGADSLLTGEAPLYPESALLQAKEEGRVRGCGRRLRLQQNAAG